MSGDAPPLLGIVGGMGPLASAELVASLYRLNPTRREQDAPACALLSDPSFPDRTAAIVGGDADALEELTRRLGSAVESLVALGASRVVVACFTVHRVLPELPRELRERVVSLVDLVVGELLVDPRPRLVLATTGSRQGGVFTGHSRWPAVEASVRWPEPADQEALHERLYRLKQGEPPAGAVPFVRDLRQRYGTRGLVFGCTELHLLYRHLAPEDAAGVVDPLATVARRFSEVAAGTCSAAPSRRV